MIFSDRRDTPFEKLTHRAVDASGKIFLMSDGNNHYLGACYVGLPLTGAGEGTVTKLASALSLPLPAGSFVQIGLLATPDVDFYVTNYLSSKKDSEGNCFEISKRHADLIQSSKDKPIFKGTGVHGIRQRLIFCIKTPIPSPRPNPEQIADVKDKYDRSVSSLSAAGINLEQLGVEDFLGILRLIADPYSKYDSGYDSTIPMREQVYSPASSVSYKDPTLITFNEGDHHARLMSIKRFPKRSSIAIMNYLIGDPLGQGNQLTDPYWLSITIHYPDQIQKKSWVRARSSMINHQVFGPTAHMIPILGYKKAGIDVLVHEMDGKGAVLCDVNLSLWLYSKDRERLSKLSAAVQAYYSSLGVEIREDRRVLEPMWNNCIPLNPSTESYKNIFRTHSMAIKHAVQFLPIIGEWTGTVDNSLRPSSSMLFMTRRGHPAPWSCFDSSTNYNGIIFAESGAGKSFLTQKLISDYLAEGAKVWAIDVGLSYYKTALAYKGEFMRFRSDSDICMNPFTLITSLEDDMDILKATIAKMAAPESSLGDYEMSLLEEAINAVYQKYGRAGNPTAVANFLLQQPQPEAQRIGKQLYPFAGGQFTRWFDGENNLDMNNAFTVLELQELKGRKALQQVVLLQLVSRINYEMYRTHGRRKLMILDEAWELLDDPMMAKAMEAAYRKARKHEGAIWVVTQSIGDLYASPNSEAIAKNSAWQMILSQKAESIDSAIDSKQFLIDPYGAYMLKSVHTVKGKYSEIMIKRGESEWGIVRLVVDKFTQVLFSTSDDERDEVIARLEGGEDVMHVVEDFIAKRQESESDGKAEEDSWTWVN